MEKFKGKCRYPMYCDSRNMYVNYIKDTYKSQITLNQLGKSINRDHSSVIHYLKQHSRLVATDNKYKERYKSYCEMLNKQPVNC